MNLHEVVISKPGILVDSRVTKAGDKVMVSARTAVSMVDNATATYSDERMGYAHGLLGKLGTLSRAAAVEMLASEIAGGPVGTPEEEVEARFSPAPEVESAPEAMAEQSTVPEVPAEPSVDPAAIDTPNPSAPEPDAAPAAEPAPEPPAPTDPETPAADVAPEPETVEEPRGETGPEAIPESAPEPDVPAPAAPAPAKKKGPYGK